MTPVIPSRRPWRGWVLLATALAAIACGIHGTVSLEAGEFLRGWTLLLVGVALLRWPGGAWRAPQHAPWEDTGERGPAWRHLILVSLLAAFFRFYRMEMPGIWGDDAINGLLAFDVLDGRVGGPFSLVRHAYSRFHALTNYLIAGSFWLFGAGPESLRLPGVIAGTLCVPLLYGTLRPLFDRRTALFAAIFCASAPLQINHSKILIQIILGQFFLLAGTCALVQGLARQRWWLAALAGAPLAMTLATYHSARIAMLIPLAYVGLRWWRCRESRTLHEVTAVVGMGVVFVVCAWPAVSSYLDDPYALVGRARSVSVWSAIETEQSFDPLFESLWKTWMIFHYQQGPMNHWLGIGPIPALSLIVGFLLVHGLVESVWRWRQPRHALLLLWLLVGLAPGLLSAEAPRVYRVLLASPPLFAWAAMPLARLWRHARASTTAGTLLRALTIGVVAAAVLLDFNDYFHRTYTHRGFRWFQAERMVEIARTLRDLGPDWRGHIMAPGFGAHYETLRFLSRAWDLRLGDVESLATALPAEGNDLFVVAEETRPALEVLRRYYPDVEPTELYEGPERRWFFEQWTEGPDRGKRIFTYFPVSREDVATFHAPAFGLEAVYHLGSAHIRRIEPYPFYQFFPVTMPQPFRVRWQGRLQVPSPGRYRLRVESNGRSRIAVDGAAISPKSRLEAGEHRLDLVIDDVPRQLRLALHWQAPGGSETLIPPDAFHP